LKHGASDLVLREIYTNLLEKDDFSLNAIKEELNEIGYSSKKIDKIINEVKNKGVL